MTLNGVMAVTLRYSMKLVNMRCRKRSVAEFMQESIVFLVRVMSSQRKFTFAISSPDEFLVHTDY